ncbi:MAG: hypothetical protein NZ889_01270, partial [Candidatus Pacearchaeota archaeon]|nr:hypothetical protein [Candidatus Pacearchaeota archaeon]
MRKYMTTIIGALIILGGFFFAKRMFLLLFGLGIIIIILPFFVSYLLSVRKEKELELKFLEFVRELSESVKAGTPIVKSIIAVSNKDFGSLTP